MDRVPPSESEVLHDAVSAPAPRADDVRSSAENGSENGMTPVAEGDGSSLVTTPATRRKPRAKKTATTTEKPKRASRRKIEPPTPVVSVPSAPLTRPDGTPAPVVHLAP